MNHGEAPHTFGHGRRPEIETAQVEPGGTGPLELPALAEGSYEAICTVPGHADLGVVRPWRATAGACPAPPGRPGASAAAAGRSTMSAQQMAAMHEQGVKDFLAGGQTETEGDRLERARTGDTGSRISTCRWSTVKLGGRQGLHDATPWRSTSRVPGPQIRVRQGDRVRFVLQNQLDQPTTVHFHGMTVPNRKRRGALRDPGTDHAGPVVDLHVPDRDPPGFYVYHSHFNSTEQVGSGLYGAIMVLPKGAQAPPRARP